MRKSGATALPRRWSESLSDAVNGSLARHGVDTAEARALASIESMRRVYEAQAAAGIPEAVAGLERIEQGRWPTSGAPLPVRRPHDEAAADG